MSRLFLVIVLAWVLVGCQDKTVSSKTPPIDEVFVGCYSTHQDSPAQIKISLINGAYTMQMKEPDGAKQAWDSPEPLDRWRVDKAWSFFRTNTLDLSQADVTHAIARPDEMMVLLKVDSAVRNINPLLDSDYVVYIFQASNTLYQVPCDDVPLDMTGVHG